MAYKEYSPYSWNGPGCAGCEYWTGMRGLNSFNTSVLADPEFEGRCLNGQGRKGPGGGCGSGKLWKAVDPDGQAASGAPDVGSPWFVSPDKDPKTGACVTCGGGAASGGAGGGIGYSSAGGEASAPFGGFITAFMFWFLVIVLPIGALGTLVAAYEGTIEPGDWRRLAWAVAFFAAAVWAKYGVAWWCDRPDKKAQARHLAWEKEGRDIYAARHKVQGT